MTVYKLESLIQQIFFHIYSVVLRRYLDHQFFHEVLGSVYLSLSMFIVGLLLFDDIIQNSNNFDQILVFKQIWIEGLDQNT